MNPVASVTLVIAPVLEPVLLPVLPLGLALGLAPGEAAGVGTVEVAAAVDVDDVVEVEFDDDAPPHAVAIMLRQSRITRKDSLRTRFSPFTCTDGIDCADS